MRIPCGELEIDLDAREIFRDGRPIRVPGRVADLLFLLAANPDRTLSRRELQEKVWKGRVVEDSAFARAISLLRDLVGDDRKVLIVTVSRRGYRFDPNADSKCPVQSKPEHLEIGIAHESANPEASETLLFVQASAGHANPLISVAAPAEQALFLDSARAAQPPFYRAARKLWLVLMALGILAVSFAIWTHNQPLPTRKSPLPIRISQATGAQDLADYVSALLIARYGGQVMLLAPDSPEVPDERTITAQFSGSGESEIVWNFPQGELEPKAAEGTTLDILSGALDAQLAPIARVTTTSQFAWRELDFNKVKRDQFAQIRAGSTAGTTLAALAVALAELGNVRLAYRIARDAKAGPLRALDACFVDFVLVDSSADDNMPMLPDTACALAKARQAEREGKLQLVTQLVDSVAVQQRPIYEALKLLELESRTPHTEGSLQIHLQRIDASIDSAQLNGWISGMARLRELKGLILSQADVVLGIKEISLAKDQYEKLGDKGAVDRCLLLLNALRATSVPDSSESLAQIFDRLPPSVDPVVASLATLVRKKVWERDSYTPEELRALGHLIVKIPSALHRDLVQRRWFRAALRGLDLDTALAIAETMSQQSRQMPLANWGARADLATVLGERGSVDLALTTYASLRALRQPLGITTADTHSCVEAFLYLEREQPDKAASALDQCETTAKSSDYPCLMGFVQMGRNALGARNTISAVAFESNSLMTDPSCRAVNNAIALGFMRSHDLAAAEKLVERWELLANRIFSIQFRLERCLLDRTHCSDLESTDGRSGPLREGRLLAYRMVIEDKCAPADIKAAQAYLAVLKPQGALASAARMQEALRYCATRAPVDFRKLLGPY